jgi:nitrite reductase (NADH) small subunit
MSETRERAGTEHVVGKTSDVAPGKHLLVKVNSLEIGIYNVGGDLYAFHNMCPHQFGPACAGPVGGKVICNSDTGWQMDFVRDGEILVCPWHGMEFDLKTGQCLTLKQMRLRSFPIRVDGDEILVKVGGRRESGVSNPEPTQTIT